jgi:hypothetical protein
MRGDSATLERTLAVAIRARARLLARGFAVAGPVRADIAGVADGQCVIVGRLAERLDHFERNGFLALRTEWIDRIHERDARTFGGELHETHAVVEVAAYLDHDRAMHHGL